MIVNSGGFYLFGTPPTTIWTRMTAFAHAGDNQIIV